MKSLSGKKSAKTGSSAKKPSRQAPKPAKKATKTAAAKKPARKRKLAVPAFPLQTYFPLPHEGRHFDLLEVFDKVNREYFGNRMKRYSIVWGRKRRQRPRSFMVFGTIQEQDRVIRIHPLLDAPFVPRWFMEYIVYHEMLHAFVPDEQTASGRRKVHTETFNEREQAFRHYRKARRWERENLLRFLR